MSKSSDGGDLEDVRNWEVRERESIKKSEGDVSLQIECSKCLSSCQMLFIDANVVEERIPVDVLFIGCRKIHITEKYGTISILNSAGQGAYLVLTKWRKTSMPTSLTWDGLKDCAEHVPRLERKASVMTKNPSYLIVRLE